MQNAYFRFYGELNDFLPHIRRETTFAHAFDWRASVKDMVESLGVPHCEVELLLVDGAPVDFDYIVQPEVRIDVYDCFHTVELPDRIPLRPPLNGKLRFVLDTHLGRLASYLRMMGFDTLYRNDYPDDELAQISNAEQRVLLTRDIGLLKRSLVDYGRFMRETKPKAQVLEVMRRYNLVDSVKPFRRCLKCNGTLNPVEKAHILDQLSTTTAQYYDEFRRCGDCGQIYWKGSHYQRMQEFMARMLSED